MTKGIFKNIIAAAAASMLVAACAVAPGGGSIANAQSFPTTDQICTRVDQLPMEYRPTMQTICTDPALRAQSQQSNQLKQQSMAYLTPAEIQEWVTVWKLRASAVVFACGTDRNCLYRAGEDDLNRVNQILQIAQQRRPGGAAQSASASGQALKSYADRTPTTQFVAPAPVYTGP